MDYKKKCNRCGTYTFEWEHIGGEYRCWECGRKARGICHHLKGVVSKYFTSDGDVEYSVTCNCKASWLYGQQPAKMELFDVLGKAWKR